MKELTEKTNFKNNSKASESENNYYMNKQVLLENKILNTLIDEFPFPIIV